MSEQKYPTPLFDNVILLPDEAEKNSMLPDELNPKPKSGRVVIAGKGKQCEETGVWIEVQVKEGDRVLFSRFSGALINISGVDHLIMKQTDFLVIL